MLSACCFEDRRRGAMGFRAARARRTLLERDLERDLEDVVFFLAAFGLRFETDLDRLVARLFVARLFLERDRLAFFLPARARLADRERLLAFRAELERDRFFFLEAAFLPFRAVLLLERLLEGFLLAFLGLVALASTSGASAAAVTGIPGSAGSAVASASPDAVSSSSAAASTDAAASSGASMGASAATSAWPITGAA